MDQFPLYHCGPRERLLILGLFFGAGWTSSLLLGTLSCLPCKKNAVTLSFDLWGNAISEFCRLLFVLTSWIKTNALRLQYVDRDTCLSAAYHEGPMRCNLRLSTPFFFLLHLPQPLLSSLACLLPPAFFFAAPPFYTSSLHKLRDFRHPAYRGEGYAGGSRFRVARGGTFHRLCRHLHAHLHYPLAQQRGRSERAQGGRQN